MNAEETMSDRETRDDMIARIASAYAGRSDVTADDIVALVSRLTRELGEVQDAPAGPAPLADDRPEPALPIDKAMTRDKVYCLCCGKGFKMLKRHLGAEHGLTEAEYRAMFGLPDDMPLVAPSYSRKKAAYAKEAGFGKYSRGGKRGGSSRAGSDENVT